ncbi:MAG: TonB-dependent receptor [Saprospiraceae bacterium]|nr:TonB-dependent receptor [Candidatus Vicinibacter affinis]MBK6822772.1 TonB-dependent receptor [Candidatus Vicinibacter affinis]MBK7304873.1 TonB-dependent receptor [Candidatus Vicinibacter affinis]MBK9640364.1 TonB-dependent receptor [Candidatus Vicinibacter affinis]HQX43078.1 carboxypeptidase-like regulatory domain-containing protein [Saprospiraceae bacterium]
MRFIICLTFFLTLISASQAQKKFTINGYLTEKSTGESLVGANVYLKKNPAVGTVSNNYGFYSITLNEGFYDLVISYTGYNNIDLALELRSDTTIQIKLSEGVLMDEIVITSDELKKNLESNEMGTIDLSVESIKRLPALLGEIDALKALQLLPGVSSATEGTAGLYVRGGGPDQNLVLLDEAVVYNTGHLLGFFSVFNSDAIRNTRLIKGSMPAEYGSRISSVIDVQMKEGNDEYYSIDGGVGLISSRITAQGPVRKHKSSFILSARRTYALDLAQPFINQTNFAGTNYYFYDLNTKINFRLSKKDRLYLSGYFGRDVFKFKSGERAFSVELPYGNATSTLRWNHILKENLFANFSMIYNDYNFQLNGGQEEFQVRLNSGVRDFSIKSDLDYYPSPSHHIKTGLRHTYHQLTPNIVSATNGEVEFKSNLTKKFAHESELYLSDDWKLNSGLSVNYGLRLSAFVFLGPYKSSLQNIDFEKGQIVKTYFVPEPRFVFNKKLDKNSSLKGGFTLASQYLHLVSNSGSTLPTDIWVPSTELVKPQIGLQYALGYFRNLFSDQIEFSIETYFKDLRNQIDYRESYVEMFSSEVENEFVYGKGRAYGIEVFIRKKKGRLNGWVGYTLSKTERWYDGIENGRVFPAVFDRPHDLVVVGSYQIFKNWQLSSTFIYATGRAYTPIQSLFIIDARPNVEYGPRNSARLEDYHRLDLSVAYDNRDNHKKRFHSSWVFSIYNLYNRRNPFFIYTDLNSNILTGDAKARAVKVSIFTLIPSVVWNFYWDSNKSTSK